MSLDREREVGSLASGCSSLGFIDLYIDSRSSFFVSRSAIMLVPLKISGIVFLSVFSRLLRPMMRRMHHIEYNFVSGIAWMRGDSFFERRNVVLISLTSLLKRSIIKESAKDLLEYGRQRSA